MPYRKFTSRGLRATVVSMRRRVISALQFFPRGGSAHVARALARELPAHGWQVTIVSGSRQGLDGHGDARRFYDGLDVRTVDFDAALPRPARSAGRGRTDASVLRGPSR
jgi:hypothetical protein